VNEGLRWQLLGPVQAWRDDAEIDLGSPQQRAILGLLLLHDGAPASTEHLISAIWGETPPSAAAGMIRSYISRLRRVLQDSSTGVVIASASGGGYSLPVAAGSLDVTRFERSLRAARDAHATGDLPTELGELQSALGLWNGTPLAGVRGLYAANERTRLVELRLTAIEDLAAAELRAGRPAEAGQLLAPLVIEQPLRERPRELMMLSMYRAGRTAEALALFQQTQRLLVDELGLDPGPGLREMQRKILTADPSLTETAAAQYDGVTPDGRAEVVAPRTPMQLPADHPAFVGRVSELNELSSRLEPSAAQLSVIGIDGLSGIGKTTLAVRLGHAVAARFPDGQFFVDLRMVEEPLSALLRAAGVANPPSSPGERSALWRSLSAGRRILVVLDDARDADQVLPLLPGAGGAAVVVTSRRRLFGLSQTRWRTLEGLPEKDGIALLEQLIGTERVQAEPTQVRRLYAQTSGLPLVLQAAGARLASRPGWGMAEAVERLGVRGRDPEWSHEECLPIQGSFESAVKDLQAEQLRAFRLLGVAQTDDFSLPAAAAVLALPDERAESLLEALVDQHLLETADGRFFFLNPVRGYARARSFMDEGEAECRAALIRLSRFYTGTLRNALLTMEPKLDLAEIDATGLRFGDVEAAGNWLQVELNNLWEITTQTAGLRDAPTEQLAYMLPLAMV
jgi:DNA-binding SARP family transcriptional activator